MLLYTFYFNLHFILLFYFIYLLFYTFYTVLHVAFRQLRCDRNKILIITSLFVYFRTTKSNQERQRDDDAALTSFFSFFFFFSRYSRISMVRGQTHAPLTRRARRHPRPLLSTSSEKCSSQRALSLIKQMATVEKFMNQSKTRNPCTRAPS